MSKNELKPCPFCGGEAVLESCKVRKGYESFIQCNGGCLALMRTITYDTEEEAIENVIKAWEKRTNNIDEKVLIERIKRHKENVRCDNDLVNMIYGLAHDHIIDIIKIMAKNTQGGTDNEQF